MMTSLHTQSSRSEEIDMLRCDLLTERREGPHELAQLLLPKAARRIIGKVFTEWFSIKTSILIFFP